MKTVRVPESMEPLFAEAERVVAKFFRHRIDDPAHGSIEIQGERYLLVRGAALSVEFFDLARTLYGEDRRAEADDFSRSILFDLAHSVGRTDAKRLHDKMQLTDPIAKLSAGPVHFAHAGWAFVEIDPESCPTPDDAYCLIYDHPYSFESDAWLHAARTSDLPVCIMNSGYSSGWCEESFGAKLVSAEILCRAKGDDTCRFVMAPPHRVQEQIAAYLSRHPELVTRAARYRIPDFFKRKREEEAMKRRQEALEHELRQTQKLEALGRLAGGIAHDFNNLMSVILGQAMLAQRRIPPNNPLAKDLDKIVRASERAAALTQQLLTFSRAQVVRTEVLDLNAIVNATAHMIERVIGDDIELKLALAPQACCVESDKAQLEQVIMNLVLNARDAMPQGGRLSIRTAREDKEGLARIVLSVSDSGVGMDEDTRTRALEPFFTTKGERGTGLGLSTVYGIVANSGGSLEIDTMPGRGCTVRVTLPRSTQSLAAPQVVEPTPAYGSGIVLAVDDKADVLEVIGQALRTHGYEPILAQSPEAALSVLGEREQRVDVLLTDVVMPRMSGVELAKRALELRSSLHVLYMSGHAPDPDDRAMFGKDDIAFLQKPFTPEALAMRLAEVMKNGAKGS